MSICASTTYPSPYTISSGTDVGHFKSCDPQVTGIATMEFVPWIFWLAMVGLVIGQVVCGVVLGHNWRPWYRRSDDPRRFWTVIAVQTLMLVAIGSLWAFIFLTDRHGKQ
jgi:H+/Cl- antiporter ClcA